jgi:SAM-dependent methyltransferase
MTAIASSAAHEGRLAYYLRWRALSGPYFEWQVEQFRPFLGQRIADVGCGPGTMTGLLAPDREIYLAIDLEQDLLDALREAYSDLPAVQTFAGSVTDAACRDRIVDDGIDTIVCSNLIEHIDDDRLALQRLSEALPVGGFLCLLVPALPALYGSFDAIDGHYRRYTKSMLRQRLQGLPLREHTLYYFNIVGAAGWFVKARLLQEQRHNEENFHLMNMITRLMRPVERLVHPPLGISLIAILQRTATTRWDGRA